MWAKLGPFACGTPCLWEKLGLAVLAGVLAVWLSVLRSGHFRWSMAGLVKDGWAF